MINFIKKNIKKRFFTKILFGLGFLLGISIVSGKSFAIDLDFDDDMLQCFPCADYAHYDVWFNVAGNDFDGVVLWSGIRDLVQETGTGILLEFENGSDNNCPLVHCDNDKIICNKQVLGLYYDKARGERVRPMDPISHSLLTGGSCHGIGYEDMLFEGGWYTDCTGLDTKYDVNPYGIYGEIRNVWTGTASLPGTEDFHLYAGLDYDFSTNQLAPESYYFVNNLQFIPNLDLPPSEQYWYYTGGLQGIMFDTYGGIGFIGDRMCVLPGDRTLIQQGEFITGYWHNDKVGEEPVWDYEILQCINGDLIGRTGYNYSTALNCYTEDGVMIPHNSGNRMREDSIFQYSDRHYVENVEWLVDTGGRNGAEFQFCRDGAISGNNQYKYANPMIAPPKDCYFPETKKFIQHGGEYTGYKYLSTDYSTSGDCQYGAVFHCDDGDIRIDENIREPSPRDLGLIYGTARRTGQETLYQNANNIVHSDRDNEVYYKYEQCVVLEPKQCVSPWGEAIGDGEYIVAYQKGKEINGQGTCQSEIRSCLDGYLNGSFEYESCQLIDLDTIPNPISCDPQSNVELSTMVTSNKQLILGLDNDVEVDIFLENTNSGMLIINGTETLGKVKVSNGDEVQVKQLSSNKYYETTISTVNLNGIKSFCAVTTKPNTETTFTDKYPTVQSLTFGQKRLIFTQYMTLLDGYESRSYNMCAVTSSLTRIIGNVVFEVNKNLITTSSNETRRVLRFKKQILEYLLTLTENYRDNLKRTIIINSAGNKVEKEVIGCDNE